MFLCMRTTIDIDDQLLKLAKQQALSNGTTLKRVVEAALRENLMPSKAKPTKFRLQWKTVRGRNLPPVDLSDRDQLYDAQIVAVCREHGVNEILSEDRDFTRFNGIHLHTL